MRKNFGSRSWLFPMPVLIIGSYDENDLPNVMNAAWGGIHDDNQLAVCIDINHKTAANIRRTGAFTVSIGDAAHTVACDYVGIVSGNTEPNKTAKAGFETVKSDFVNAPVILDLPMTLECSLLSFDEKTGCTTGKIINISADESILDENGQITLDKFFPICYNPVDHTYRKIGEVCGHAFADGKKLM